MKMGQSILKRRHTKFRRQGNYPEENKQQTQKIKIIHLLAYEDGTECSETSAYKIQTPGNYPEENIQQTQKILVTLGSTVARIWLWAPNHNITDNIQQFPICTWIFTQYSHFTTM